MICFRKTNLLLVLVTLGGGLSGKQLLCLRLLNLRRLYWREIRERNRLASVEVIRVFASNDRFPCIGGELRTKFRIFR